jgi:hypothetical protein
MSVIMDRNELSEKLTGNQLYYLFGLSVLWSILSRASAAVPAAHGVVGGPAGALRMMIALTASPSQVTFIPRSAPILMIALSAKNAAF